MNLDERKRAYIYRILTAAVAVALSYDIITDSQASLWVALGSAILGLPLAVFNTSTKASS